MLAVFCSCYVQELGSILLLRIAYKEFVEVENYFD